MLSYSIRELHSRLFGFRHGYYKLIVATQIDYHVCECLTKRGSSGSGSIRRNGYIR